MVGSCQNCQWIIGSGAVAISSTALGFGHVTFAAWVAAVAFVGIVAIQAAVLRIAWKDPSKLMLTEMSGPEFTQHQKTMTGGDSDTGQHPELLVAPTTAPDVVTKGVEGS